MSSDNDKGAGKRPTWPGGISAVLTQMEGRRDALSYAETEAPPPADLALAPLADQIVADPDDDPAEAPPFRSSYHRKRHALRKELTGETELVFLNGLLIAHLRKRDFPAHLPALFQRLWAEQGPHLLARLNPRWLVSTVTTFGDHGTTPTQRSVGLALTVLFGTMKLYESERLYSGLTADRPFPLDQKAKGPLPLEMDAYAIANGGLDVNMIGRLWTEAEDDPVLRPLAHHLLDLLIHDEHTLFRRLMTMRNRKARKEAKAAPAATPAARGDNPAPVPAAHRRLSPETLRWGLVSTIRAPLPQIARFAAHHLELGAEALHLYLDSPDPGAEAFLSRHPRLHITQCDAGYWEATGKTRMDAHQLRQAHNATRCLRAVADSLDWLGHIDVDEFLLPDRPVARILADVSPRHALARIAPAEALARDDGPPQHFKLTHRHADQPKAVLQDIYPTFGLHLYGGFLSHTSGKVFARTGIPDTRLGIHTMKYHGADATNRARPADIRLAHLHAPSWEHFLTHLSFRREKGSYRPRSERVEMGQAQLIAFLAEDEGEAGLRLLFDEVCADTPELRARLVAHDMLVSWPFDPDAAVARVFGALP
ncbi:glycosyltransferase family 2 protein [Salipiger sp. P9]|uniref:glycosyltransferase family 2 protein n=1 Tax=Salipiger pentaromativorans TaxID=2943193 RepID=UPI0021573F5F|nr:glycosyltransferase family 2 protein [Salipiger pentaromativorans]MCR8546220.1 glycosyltransferase family 2 protein [Salipiger pentaromativorans]